MTDDAALAERALTDSKAWATLVTKRRRSLRAFLEWASECEAGGRGTSLRLENRDDLERCRQVLALFAEDWWGVAVYSCFDSIVGTTVAASRFAKPVPEVDAAVAIAQLQRSFPKGSVQHHRAQATLKRAKASLLAVSGMAPEVREILTTPRLTFEERVTRLTHLNIDGWGRTTCFDAVLRAGAFKLDGVGFRPQTAHLLGSTGPKNGFEEIWGLRVDRHSAQTCEQILCRWTREWATVAEAVGIAWTGRPYDSGDLENALCVFQDGRPGSRPRPSRSKC